jgi:hypothetical protein
VATVHVTACVKMLKLGELMSHEDNMGLVLKDIIVTV